MSTPLAWNRTHGEHSLGDPPLAAAASAGPSEGEEGLAGASAPNPFTLREGDMTVWDVITQPDTPGPPEELEALVEALALCPEYRSAALLRSMGRVRDLLDELPGYAPVDHEVKVVAGDLVVLVRALLGRLR